MLHEPRLDVTIPRPVMPVSESMHDGAVAIGYINAERLSERRLELVRRGLYAWAHGHKIDLTTVLIERNSAARPELRELHEQIRTRVARYVVVPDLTHLSEHPLLQGERLDNIQSKHGATVLSVDAHTTPAFPNL